MGRRVAVVVVAMLAGTGISSCSGGADATPVASSFLAAWAGGRFRAAGDLTDQPGAAARFLRQTDDDLGVSSSHLELVGVHEDGSRAVATFSARLVLAGLGPWTYRGQLPLARVRQTWRVRWSPADVHPAVPPNGRVVRFRTLPPRADILAGDGSALVGAQPVVEVGLVPGAVTDLPGTLATLARTTGVDPGRVSALVSRARPGDFVPVITLRQAAYQAVKPALYPLPGVRFRQETADLAPSPTFGLAVLGRVGAATAEALRQAGAPYEATDRIGLSGLELAFQHRLAGTPTGGVEVLDGGGAVLRRILLARGGPGNTVRTTLDPAMQAAAEKALSGVAQPAALVAVRASTGEILAAANAPADSTLDRALVGSYPPGSSFKVVTTLALLVGAGLDPAATVPCPHRAVVDGKPFTNFEGEAPGAVSFSVDFALSCNTAFVGLASHLAAASLESAASTLGVGARWNLPVPAFSAPVPPPVDTADLAADAIGQGRVLVSPLTMALVAGAVESGTWRPPVLVTDPSPPGPASAPQTLPTGADAELRQLMRLVVTSGTGTAANLPGTPVYGKTGTAEFGSASPPRTHAWFIGFRGDVAFAVVVEGGGVGGEVAAPVAARFLQLAG
ncbi:MAG TPA: penicillin-binding transpeptidase domain-containing protein [Acidimicrobiales bacterium]|nr:penicillin-binding transpeptidase domain-containing protein [Acidimicrobiales bacterium]